MHLELRHSLADAHARAVTERQRREGVHRLAFSRSHRLAVSPQPALRVEAVRIREVGRIATHGVD